MAESRPRTRSKRWRIVAWIVGSLVLLGGIACIAISKWAFGRDQIRQDLADATSGTVDFKSFRNVYIPRPGCVIEGVTLRRKDGGSEPLVFVRKLTIVSNLSAVIHKHVSVMKAEGLRVTPGGKGWPESRSQSQIVVDEMVADDALLQILGGESKQPLNFKVHHFSLNDVGGDHPMPFRVELANPMPPGEISATGKLGPWKSEGRDQISVSGSYSFRHADLSAIGGIGGLLSSDGKFQGVIRQIEVSGHTDTPQFEVTSTHHKFPLSTDFHAEVNATTGDVILHDIEAKLRDTAITGTGKVVPDEQDHRRTATLQFAAKGGHIEDILFPFVKNPHSPVTGETNFHGQVTLPGGKEPFVRRVRLEGDFGIDDAHLTSPKSQHDLDKASARARGNPDTDHPEDVVSDLKGHVQLKDGVATFANFSFAVPGALASMHGTYNVVNERINLHGILRLQAKLTETTGGFKGFLLKAISPFIKDKDKPNEPLPVAVTGTYDHPQYSVSLTKDNQRRHGM